MKVKIILFCMIAIGLAGCDVDGEVRQGDISSTISSNSGAAGGNAPVLGGVYYDSEEGLTISDSGMSGDILTLNNQLQPQWVALEDISLPSNGREMTGNIALNGHFLSGDLDNEGIYIDSLGNVGVGTDAPEHELHVVGNASKTEGGTTWLVVSDLKLKENIKVSEKGLNEINQLKVKTFSYKSDHRMNLSEKEDVGLIAQEVQNIFPEAIRYSGQYMLLDYHPIYMAQIKAIQELTQKNQLLEKRLLELEKKFERMKK